MNTYSVNVLASFRKRWIFDRTLSVDLLNSLNDSELQWSPHPTMGELWKQFRHVGRVQEDYINALVTKTINFSCKNKHYTQGPNKLALIDYLAQLDVLLFKELEKMDFNKYIDWFGEQIDILEHLSRLSGHETLHHGQLIVYCQLLGKTFPDSWHVWGLK